MKHFVFLLMGITLLTACQDNVLHPEQETVMTDHSKDMQEGMQRIVASSTEELEQLIVLMGDGLHPSSRAVSSATLSTTKKLSYHLLRLIVKKSCLL